ncbi:MAG: hypothetical protein EOP18_04305 [Rhizobiaceae bacterium]|nr:MAG: hypothetical protein EOP18_04305 [Rhizobiaceae bacterium]
MQSQPQPFKRSYMSKEESFMYDREGRVPMVDTMNAARIEYTEKGVMHLASRRCDLIKISPRGAMFVINTQFTLPKSFYLDIPDARINRVGCVLMKVHPNNIVETRFLSPISDRDLNRIYAFSTHPSHRDVLLDVRA